MNPTPSDNLYPRGAEYAFKKPSADKKQAAESAEKNQLESSYDSDPLSSIAGLGRQKRDLVPRPASN